MLDACQMLGLHQQNDIHCAASRDHSMVLRILVGPCHRLKHAALNTARKQQTACVGAGRHGGVPGKQIWQVVCLQAVCMHLGMAISVLLQLCTGP